MRRGHPSSRRPRKGPARPRRGSGVVPARFRRGSGVLRRGSGIAPASLRSGAVEPHASLRANAYGRGTDRGPPHVVRAEVIVMNRIVRSVLSSAAVVGGLVGAAPLANAQTVNVAPPAYAAATAT